MSAYVFCQIAAGDLPSWIVMSNEHVVAFLDKKPATRGHMLIVTREHRRDLWALLPNEATAAMSAARQLAHAARSALGATGMNLKQNNGEEAGQDVFHFHLHVIPRYPDDTVLPGCVWGIPRGESHH